MTTIKIKGVPKHLETTYVRNGNDAVNKAAKWRNDHVDGLMNNLLKMELLRWEDALENMERFLSPNNGMNKKTSRVSFGTRENKPLFGDEWKRGK